jgi:hypothetical protein
MEDKQLQFIAMIIQALLDRGLVFRSPWLTTREAASYCRLSESYLNALRPKGRGPQFKKEGRIRLYRKDWLDSWLSDGADKK